MRILYAEGKPGDSIPDGIIKALSHDHALTVATSGTEASGILHSDQRFDMIIVDGGLPVAVHPRYDKNGLTFPDEPREGGDTMTAKSLIADARHIPLRVELIPDMPGGESARNADRLEVPKNWSALQTILSEINQHMPDPTQQSPVAVKEFEPDDHHKQVG